MKQPYIGNKKINKLYKGSELWCNWVSGGSEPVEPSDGYVTEHLMICCDAYGKTSSDSFDGFYDSINNKNFILKSGIANYETNCLNLTNAYLLYGNGVSEYGSILKKTLKNTTFEIVFKCGSYNNNSWRNIFALGKYDPTPLALRPNLGRLYSGNEVVFLINNNPTTRMKINCLSKSKYWNHIIVSIDDNNIAKIYINGQYLFYRTVNSYDNNDSYYSEGLYFGSSNASDCPLMSIGCFRYYNKALTENEVMQNFNYEQTITRVTTLEFPSTENDDEIGDTPNPESPGEMSKGGTTSE